MGYETQCPPCRGTGRRRISGSVCPRCAGTGEIEPYRRWPTTTQWEALGYGEVAAWPVQPTNGKCRACGKALTGRKTAWCGAVSCHRAWWRRLYEQCTWIKRHLIVERGCACELCGEVFESPLFPGGPVYPDPRRLQVDHIAPLIDGGDDSPQNLQLACEACHKAKTAMEARERARSRGDEAIHTTLKQTGQV